MKSEPQLSQYLNKLMQNSNTSWNSSTQNESSCGIQAYTEIESTSDAIFNFPDGNLQGNEMLHIERKLEDGNSSIPSKPTCDEHSTVDSEMASVAELFDESWPSFVSDFHLESVPDVAETKLSPESIVSDMSLLSPDNAPSLDDVFQVLDEIDAVRSALPMDASLSTPSTHPMVELSQSYSSDGLHQLPTSHISSSDPCNSFQSFDFNLMKGLQSPSRGLVTAVRRLCELLSEPRNDHLNFVFVRVLNNALKEMEDAVRHQSNRARRNNERNRKWPNKSASDAEKSFEPMSTGPSRSFTSKSQSLSALPNQMSSCTETVDLTGLDDWKNENFQLRIEKESFIALDDTVSEFVHEQFPILLSM